jgi:hypothetical protein
MLSRVDVEGGNVMDPVQLIKPGEGRKVRLPTGKIIESGTEWWRVDGERDSEYRKYETRYHYGTATTIVKKNELKIIGGGFGGDQTYSAGTLKYDALVAQVNALEDKIYYSAKNWNNKAQFWCSWCKRGKPELNKTQVKQIALYEKYSPMTKSC